MQRNWNELFESISSCNLLFSSESSLLHLVLLTTDLCLDKHAVLFLVAICTGENTSSDTISTTIYDGNQLHEVGDRNRNIRNRQIPIIQTRIILG